MKLQLIPIVIFLLTTLSCSEDNINDSIPAQIVTEEWHLTKSSGGIKSTNNQFNFDVIIWIFSSNNNTISITNNSKDATKATPLASGTYKYSILEINGNNYILIEGDEFGEISLPNTDMLIINQNKTSSGNATGLYTYSFERKLITQDVVIN